ncbi:MAG: ABC transporter permease [Pseudomonadales bacterium]
MAEAQLDTAPVPAGGFEPLHAARRVQALSRPSLSYWQDAWRRLKANRRALFSLYVVVGLLLFTVAGPLLWRVDPAAQDLDQISRPPGTSRAAIIVAPYSPWDGSSVLPLQEGLGLAAPATTQSVRLRWDPLPGASGYRVYRNIFAPGPGDALGLPLQDIYAGQPLRFEDRLDLRPRTYYYSVVALDGFGHELEARTTLEVAVARVITVADARDRGLIDADANPAPGDAVKLALHPLGTDYLGRDLLARLMYGARVSLFIGLCAPLLYVLFGVVYGSAAGFLGGHADHALMRFADFVVALPFLLFMILFKIAFGIGPGESGILPMVVAMVMLSWPATARLVRGQILQIREEGYIGASRLLGARTGYLITRHMIPNTMGVILVTLTFAVPSAIFTEAFLSFIGMGVAPPTPSWGSMCNEGINTMLTYPHELIFPALFISITVLAFNMLGDGLRDALDARMRSRE